MTTELELSDDALEIVRSFDGRLDPLGASVAINSDAHGAPLPLNEDAIGVNFEGRLLGVTTLPPLSKLFRGTVRCPEITGEPPLALQGVFLCVELTAAAWCVTTGRRVRDEEFEKLYGELRRRPDGRFEHPLFAYLRAAMRLAMVIRPTSEDEFDKITRRLARSARTFRESPTSANYLDLALRPLAHA